MAKFETTVIKGHRDLNVWKNSLDLVEDLYRRTKDFPREEMYSLISQIRRSALSIPSNIAEGAARNSKKEFVQFLYVALGSTAELETHLILSERLGYLTDACKFHDKLNEIKKMLLGLITFLRKK